MLLYLGGILIVHFILLLKYAHSNIHAWNIDFSVNKTTCMTEECTRHGSYILSILNPDINPCNDFYEFVCSKWQKKHPIPASYPEWKINSELEEVAFERMRKILEEKSPKHDFPALKKAKQIYKDCTDIPDLGMIDAPTMRSYVKLAGHFPLLCTSGNVTCHEENWLNVHNYYLSLTGESALFDIYSRADIRNNLNSLLHISEIVSPYGLIKMKKRMPVKKEPNYRLFLATAANRVIPASEHKLSSAVIENRLRHVFHFRDALLMTLTFKQTNAYNKESVMYFDNWYNGGVKKYAKTAQIPWVDVIASLYKNKKPLNKIQHMKMNVKNKSYFRSLARLLSETPVDVIVNHIHLYFIERHLELDSYMYMLLLDVIVQDGKLQAHLDYSGKRWQSCISCNAMRDTIAKVYAQKYVSSSTKKEIMSLIKKLQSMISIKIADCDWLDSDAMEEATYLINNLKVTIDSDCELNTDRPFGHSIDTCGGAGILDIFYSTILNCISISNAYFQLPLYSPTLPYSVTYGSIGSILGHEMFHALDPLFNRYSTSSKQFCCSSKVSNTYGAKAKCFVKQFDKVPVKELERIEPIPTIDGHKTLHENIADTMGLRFAYETFRKQMWETGSCQVLPLLPCITCEELFFISFASSYCASAKSDTILEDLETGDHSTPRLRVNGALSNMKEFSKVFYCPENSPMNSRYKCNLFE